MSNDAWRIVVDIAPKDSDEDVEDYLGVKDVKEIVESVLTTVRASLPPTPARSLVVRRCSPVNVHSHVHYFGDCENTCNELAYGCEHPGDE